MTFWHGFAGGLQLGASARDRWDERGGLSGIFGGGGDGAQAADKPMSDVSAASSESGSPASANGPASSSSVEWPADLNAAARSIRTIESGSAEGNYSALGPVTNRGDRAYGAYQVMGANIPSWTERHYGQRLTPQQFLQNPEAQDKVFQGQFGQYMSRYGAEGASRAWFAGEGGMNRMSRQDVNGTSVGGYNSRFGQLYNGFLNRGQSGGPSAGVADRNRTYASSGDAEGMPEPIRVQPGELQIPSIFDNQVAPDAGQQIQQNPEIEGLVASSRREAPGLGVIAPASGGVEGFRQRTRAALGLNPDGSPPDRAPPAPMTQGVDVDAAVRGAMPNYVFRRTPGAGPGNTTDAMGAAGPEGYGRGRAGVSGGGRGAASEDLQPPLRAGEAAPVGSAAIYRDDAPPAPVRVENASIDPAAAARGGVSPGGRAAATGDNQPPLRAGEAGPTSSPEIYRDERPPTEPRVENGDLEARAYASGGVSQGGRGATSAVREAPGLGLQARAVAPRALRAGEVDSATDPQMAPSPTGTGTATGTASGAAGGRASVSVEVPNAPREAPVPQPRPDPAAAPAPAQAAPAAPSRRRPATPSEGNASAAPAATPAPQPRPQPPAAAATAPAARQPQVSERDRLMMLRDPASLGPGEEAALRAGLPAGSLRMPDHSGVLGMFGSPRSARSAPVRSAEKPTPSAPAAAPAQAAPATTGSTPASAAAPSEPAPAAAPTEAPTAAPSERRPDPETPRVPYPEPRNDQERFANIRHTAQQDLDRGATPRRVADRLSRQGVPFAEWPESLRAAMERRPQVAQPSGNVQEQDQPQPFPVASPPPRPAPGLAIRSPSSAAPTREQVVADMWRNRQEFDYTQTPPRRIR